VKKLLRQSVLAVMNVKQVVCLNCDQPFPCSGSTTNLLGWKREMWVSYTGYYFWWMLFMKLSW